MKRWIMLCVGLMLLPMAQGQTLKYQYWFDGQYDSHLTDSILITGGQMSIDVNVASVETGIHALTLMLQDTADEWGALYNNMFVRVPDTVTGGLGYRVWFDDDYTTILTGALAGNMMMLDVPALSVGLHSVNIYIEGGNTPQNYVFFKVEDTIGVGQRYHCWFDGDISTMQTDVLSGPTFQIDVAALSDGLHTVTVQIERGARSIPLSYIFFKMPVSNGTDGLCRYWFDNKHTEAQTMVANGSVLLLDVSQLSNGLHYVNFQLGGDAVPPMRQLFYKIPNGGYGITRYEYCLNGDWEQRRTYDTTAVDTLRLITLLPVDTLPIRSTCFEFDPNDGTPVIYAKNEINFRFWDNEYRFVESAGRYVDMNVVDTVRADTLERDTTKVIPVPNNNDIHWFKLVAGTGDSLSFHTDRRCTMQLYAPSGEMVFRSSGDSVLTWQGCHAWESGDYYLAIHDAEGTGNIAVFYQWIYRYAVLAWDVHRVGNGGVSTITFEGNGFYSLDTVFLVKGTDTVPNLYIDRQSNTTVGVILNFENADTGMYNATFVYVDETIYKTNVVVVDTAIPIVLKTRVSYPETFLRGSTVTYTLEITNTGNMTAYFIPLFTYIGSPTKNGITHIKYDGLHLHSIIDGIEMDSLSSDEVAELEEWAERMGDDHYFFKFHKFDSIIGDSVWVRSNYFPPIIAPYETKVLSLKLTTSDSVDVWFKLPDTCAILKYHTFDPSFQPLFLMSKSSGWGDFAREGYCCVRNNIKCVLDLIGEGLDIAGLITEAAPGTPLDLQRRAGQCITGLLNDFNSAMGRWLCEEDMTEWDWKDFVKYVMDWESVTSTAIKCIKRFIPQMPGKKIIDVVEKFTKMIDDILKYSGYSHASNMVNCVVSLVEQKPNCPPCLSCSDEDGANGSDSNEENGGNGKIGVGGGGGTSTPVNSFDPNEITGFIAESGSLTVGMENKQHPYVVDFENDTMFATAHAHTVVVCDTLAGNVFDLNSFSTSSFAIGDVFTTINRGQSFTCTMDMRPKIDVLVQVRLDYHIDSTFAVATWTFSSLDPMTLQPTMVDTLGFLGIGGTGEVSFTINRKANLPDSTLIDNRAWITFDNEDPIATSTWRNIVDITPPVSSIDSVAYQGETAIVEINATDNLSGVWRYHVYAQLGDDVLLPVAMNIPIDSVVSVVPPVGTVHLHSAAIDSAGNVENVVIVPPCATIYDTIVATACDSYTWLDSVYTISGDYVRTRTSAIPGGCDTVSTLQLTLNVATTGDTIATACDSFAWHGTIFTASTNTPTFTTQNTIGCDSTVTLHLTINHSTTGDTSATACDTFTWWNNVYTNSTDTPTHTYNNAAGCDSTVTLHLTINNSTMGDTSAVACDTFTWWNNVYTNSTNTPTHTYNNAAGCDSTVTLHLTINNSTMGDTSAVACDTFIWWNNVYTSSTDTPTHTYNNADGCDSTVTLHLIINHSAETTVTDTAEGSYIWLDSTYTESGTYQWHGVTSAGCDSTVILILVINQIGIEVVDGTGLGVVVYPNPTTGKLTIDADGVLLVEVLDQTGHIVATYEQTNRIDLGGLPVGGYLLKIHLSKGISVQRVMLK